MKHLVMFMMIVAVTMTGCIWIDDDDDHDHSVNLEEEIIYINRTPYAVENYIDDIFVGTVTANSELHVFGYNYDGYHRFFSRAVEIALEWGPTEFFLHDGERFRVYLENAGMRGVGESNPAVQ